MVICGLSAPQNRQMNLATTFWSASCGDENHTLINQMLSPRKHSVGQSRVTLFRARRILNIGQYDDFSIREYHRKTIR